MLTRASMVLGAAALALFAMTGTSIAAPPPPNAALLEAGRELTGAERDAAVKAASLAFEKVKSAEGGFVQTGPDGSIVNGRLAIRRPGKMRFEYEAPNPLLIVSDGAFIIVHDRQLKTYDRYPLSAWPLGLVLGAKVDLAKQVDLVKVVKRGDQTFVTVRDRANKPKGELRADGELTLQFSGAGYRLAGWTVKDGQGLQTRLVLLDLRETQKLDPRLFILRDPKESGGRGR